MSPQGLMDEVCPKWPTDKWYLIPQILCKRFSLKADFYSISGFPLIKTIYIYKPFQIKIKLNKYKLLQNKLK